MNTYTYTCSVCSIVAQAENPSIAANLINLELMRARIPIRVDPSDLTLFKHTTVRVFKHR